MSAGHWAVVVAVVLSVGTQLAGIESWEGVRSPQFIAGLLLSVGGAIGALFTDKVEVKNVLGAFNKSSDR
jgi:hypothetical protein